MREKSELVVNRMSLSIYISVRNVFSAVLI